MLLSGPSTIEFIAAFAVGSGPAVPLAFPPRPPPPVMPLTPPVPLPPPRPEPHPPQATSSAPANATLAAPRDQLDLSAPRCCPRNPPPGTEPRVDRPEDAWAVSS